MENYEGSLCFPGGKRERLTNGWEGTTATLLRELLAALGVSVREPTHIYCKNLGTSTINFFYITQSTGRVYARESQRIGMDSSAGPPQTLCAAPSLVLDSNMEAAPRMFDLCSTSI